MPDPEIGSRPAHKSDRNSWNWLLLIPVVLPLATSLFNADSPRLAGMPVFYWLQLAFVVLGVAVTTTVYKMTRQDR